MVPGSVRRVAPALAFVLGLLGACGPPAVPDAEDAGELEAPPSPARASAFGRLDFGHAPPGLDGLDARACAACHAEHADEWRASAHGRAFVDPLFVEEWSGQSFCSDCHAPRAGDPSREPELAAAGVDCATCHVREGVVYASEVSGDAPHPSVADPTRAGVSLCATCHQFGFPHDPDQALQNTVVEWEASGATHGCAHCHAPQRGGHTDHRFPGHRDPELLARALIVEGSATRDGWSTDVQLELRANRVEHAVPTGDVFRRLVVRAWVEGREGNAASVTLGRRFDVAEDGTQRAAEDERVPPPGQGERVVALRIPDSGPRILWSIDLWSLDPRNARRFDQDVTLHTRMAQGAITSR